MASKSESIHKARIYSTCMMTLTTFEVIVFDDLIVLILNEKFSEINLFSNYFHESTLCERAGQDYISPGLHFFPLHCIH